QRRRPCALVVERTVAALARKKRAELRMETESGDTHRRPGAQSAMMSALSHRHTSSRSARYGPVRLHHAQGWKSRSAQARHPEGHLSFVFSGRKNRRAGTQWLG